MARGLFWGLAIDTVFATGPVPLEWVGMGRVGLRALQTMTRWLTLLHMWHTRWKARHCLCHLEGMLILTLDTPLSGCDIFIGAWLL